MGPGVHPLASKLFTSVWLQVDHVGGPEGITTEVALLLYVRVSAGHPIGSALQRNRASVPRVMLSLLQPNNVSVPRVIL